MKKHIYTANSDVTHFKCDILVLKYAQALYGADYAVTRALNLSENDVKVQPGGHLLIPTNGNLAFQHVLFIGVPSLATFGYGEIRRFAETAMNVVSSLDVAHAHVAMTMHGAGFGLDEREAFTAQVAGILEYFALRPSGVPPDRVTIAERQESRFRRISALLDNMPGMKAHEPMAIAKRIPIQEIPDAGIDSDSKRLVFVAMPYTDEMEDVFEFGIKEPINNAGGLCERCDREAFTGDVLDRIRNRIAESDVVIADMTGANPNVYLEVGYAWGKNVQTLLIAREGEDLKFDVKTHRCIFYKNINHLRILLTDFLKRLIHNAKNR